jgi:hypothetical protein
MTYEQLKEAKELEANINEFKEILRAFNCYFPDIENPQEGLEIQIVSLNKFDRHIIARISADAIISIEFLKSYKNALTNDINEFENQLLQI